MTPHLKPLCTFSTLTAMLLILLSGGVQAAIPLPAEQLFAPQPQQMPKLSPDGRMISFLGPWQQQSNLYVRLLDKPEPLPPLIPEEETAAETDTSTEQAPPGNTENPTGEDNAAGEEKTATTPAAENTEVDSTTPDSESQTESTPDTVQPITSSPRPTSPQAAQGYSSSGSTQTSLFPDYSTSLSLYELSEKERTALYRAPIRVSNQRLNGISQYDWISNHQLVYEVPDERQQSSQLFLVTPERRGRRQLTQDGRALHHLLDPLSNDPEHILITSNQRDNRVNDVYKLNLESGQQILLEANSGTIIRWLTDREGKLRAAVSQNGLQWELLYRDAESEPFRVSYTSQWPDRVNPLRFTDDNLKLYVSNNIDRDTLAIQLYDPQLNQLQDLLYENPQADLEQIVVTGAEQRVTAVAYETDKPQYHFFDDKDAELFNDLFQRSGQRTLQQISSTSNGSRSLFRILNDVEPPRYYLYQRTDNSYRELFNRPPYPLRAQMAPMIPVDFRVRDGSMLHGYVTMPQGYQRGAIPFVILPHKEPYRGRHHWGFNPLVQFLASRGYGVMQVNYRGSAGYGKQYALAGRWGNGIMQQDLADAITYLRRQGVALKHRIAIVGERYAGYAAVAGAAFDPADYRCAAAMAAPLDPFHWLESLPPQEEVYRVMIQQLMGDPIQNAAKLKADSPLSAINQIRAPILIAQGRQDPRTRMADLDKLVTTMRTRSIKVETLIKGDEYGPFKKFDNQLDFYRKLDQFLDQCLNR
ncbi:prolyl oligopeptidase family serine peptidase [Aestuariirhabdus sp. Z084]|uniref:alpha/beta hydrolase family protein n=1 Tax=Aestuariirhabdus haliotis TaxID=2918751 RepID=UPI00201B3DEC|nr:prolyl oligopeptidase family serine peptidase [Aestuariirhabdus haliotis]MCL6415042.1 prolyl oligopeptidase family serine peptidase [Aestuariirhabdus haliotis]MCL6418974.1 prolyl oligopeptidase family serine peptidase [Aestuariirhabdus haliotis]